MEENKNKMVESSILSPPFEGDDTITPQEQKELADIADDDILLSEQYRYPQDTDRPEQRDASDSPLPRTFLILGGVGIVVVFFLFLFIGLSGGGSHQAKQETSKSEPQEEEVFDESDEYLAQLALINQSEDIQQDQQSDRTRTARLAQQKDTPTNSKEKANRDNRDSPAGDQERVRRTTESPPPPRRVEQPDQPSRRAVPEPLRASTPPVLPLPPPDQPSSESLSAPSVPEPIDPLERWNLLASIGTQGGDSDRIAAFSDLDSVESLEPERSDSGLTSINWVRIGRHTNQQIQKNLTQTNDVDSLTVGARGIIRKQRTHPVGIPSFQQATTYEVPIGSSVAAEVTVPMIWAEDGSSPTAGRFAVTLIEPLLDKNGEVALPEGTVLITEIAHIIPDSNMVNQSAVAIVYRDHTGNLQQQPLPPDNLLIRGQDNRPLIAQGLHDPGGEIFQQDLLIGLLSSLGRIGEIINRPQEEIVRQEDGFERRRRERRITRDQPNILAAAVEGFFSTTAQRLNQRSQQAIEEQLIRQNVLIVPEGEEVTVFVNAFLEVNR